MDIDRNALIPMFVAESAENLAELESSLLRLEAAPESEELLAAIFRAAHTLKGNADALGMTAITSCAHALESLLDAIRRKRVASSSPLVTLMLRAHVAIESMVATVSRGEEPDGAENASLVEQLAAAASGKVTSQEGQVASIGARIRTRSLRVDLATLDAVLACTSALTIARTSLQAAVTSRAAPEVVTDALREVDRHFGELRALVMRVRLVRVEPLFQQQNRVVRDVSVATGKRARLVAQHNDVHVDTTIVEGLRDPIMHMVRNALDHGLETPEERRRAGKDEIGTITLRARHEAGRVIIEVSDDGAGLDRDRILSRARATGLVKADAKLDERAIDALVFSPGFSTAQTVTALSGRGVGMDVVARRIATLNGTVTIESTRGRGTTMTIRVPLTLAIIDGFAVKASGDTYLFPLENVRECVDMPVALAGADDVSGLVDVRGAAVPFVRLRSLFRKKAQGKAKLESIVIVEQGNQRAGIAVDALDGESEIVVRPLDRTIRKSEEVVGATILADGRVGLVLDVRSIIARATAEAS
jgi:two-component system chemotaxis sensor kinase CheA